MGDCTVRHRARRCVHAVCRVDVGGVPLQDDGAGYVARSSCGNFQFKNNFNTKPALRQIT